MGIRDLLGGHARGATIASLTVIALGASVIAWETAGGSSTHAGDTGKCFFSDDDGQTWFIDDAEHVPPFAHDGKTAYRAILFRAAGGKPFVGRLESYSDDDKAKIEEAMNDAPRSKAAVAFSRPALVKRPGGRTWFSGQDAPGEYQKVMLPLSPDGRPGGVAPVHPGDADAGR